MPTIPINRLFSVLPWITSLALVLVFSALLVHELGRQNRELAHQQQLYSDLEQLVSALERAHPYVALDVQARLTQLRQHILADDTRAKGYAQARRELIAKWLLALVIAEVLLLLLLHLGLGYIHRLMAGHQRIQAQERDAVEAVNQRLLRQKEALDTLNDIAALPLIEPREQVRSALQVGAQYLGQSIGLVSRINEEDYLVQVQISPAGMIHDDQSFDLAQTYCRLMLATGDVLAIDHMGNSEYADYPPYKQMGLESYIGAPLWVEGRLYGTVAFSSASCRLNPFDEADRDFIRLLARWLGAVLDRWCYEENRRELLVNLSRVSAQREAILNAASVSIISTDTQGLIQTFNRGAEKMLGYRAEEVIGQQSLAVVHEPDEVSAYGQRLLASDGYQVQEPFAVLTARAARGEVDENEWRYVRKNGSRLTVLLAVTALRDNEGALQGFLAVARDITELKQASLALQASESRFRGLVSNLPGVVYRCAWDEHWSMQYMSDSVSELTGYAAGDFIDNRARTFVELIVPEDRTRVVQTIREAVQRTHPYALDCRLLRRDGSVIWVQTMGRGVYSTRGELRSLDGFIWDVTEHKRMEEDLRVSQQRFVGAFETAPQGMALVSPSGRWLEVNHAFCQMLGHTREEFLQLDFQRLTHPDDLNADLELIADVLAGKLSSYQMEKRYRHSSGEWVWVLLSVSLVRDSEGEPLHFVAQVLDITEHKRIELMKNEFIAMVSHELRTPLTSISGSLGLLQGGVAGELAPKALQMVRIAHNNSLRLKGLVDDLLDMEKLNAGKMTFDLQPQPLLAIVRQAIEANAGYGAQHGVQFLLAPDAVDGLVMVDALRLQQVLANYLSNAAKFSPAGADVLVNVQAHNDGWRVTVRDRGPGIPEEFRSRIFQKFSQADSSDTRKKGGTGLGLAICKELIARMGGQVGFESAPGEGSCFYFDLPPSVAKTV